MKIGILTFHWSPNYGAVLQAWCLQEYLTEHGHDVDIINYKPSQYDFSWMRIVRHPSLWKGISRSLFNRRKEALLVPFRQKYHNLTRRYSSVREFGNDLDKYDILISGSDQVLNPGFTLYAENMKPSPVYWLGVGADKTKRIGYAVSFGYEKYPEDASMVAKRWVNRFDCIGTRERSGQHILDVLGYMGSKSVVPDPTLLFGGDIFKKLGISLTGERGNYMCVYMLRHEIEVAGEVCYIDEKHNPLTMEQWLITIGRAGQMITNSYHGTLMAIFAHVPFAILLETGLGSGMNDRFFTLLEKVGCIERVAETVDEALEILKSPIDFYGIDHMVSEYRKVGEMFLESVI